MPATTPHMKDIELLEPLASRYVDVEALPWKPTPSDGIDMKVLLEDKETGLLTALFRWQPGAHLALHEHVEIEQTYVLEGSIEDAEGVVDGGQLRVAADGEPPRRLVAGRARSSSPSSSSRTSSSRARSPEPFSNEWRRGTPRLRATER